MKLDCSMYSEQTNKMRSLKSLVMLNCESRPSLLTNLLLVNQTTKAIHYENKLGDFLQCLAKLQVLSSQPASQSLCLFYCLFSICMCWQFLMREFQVFLFFARSFCWISFPSYLFCSVHFISHPISHFMFSYSNMFRKIRH